MAGPVCRPKPDERVLQEREPACRRESRAGVVARQVPGLLDERSGAHESRWDAHGYRILLDLDLQPLDLVSIAAVELVQNLAVELDVDPLCLRRLDEGGLARRADSGPRDGACPLAEALRLRHADLELPVVRSSILERLDPAEERAEVAHEEAARVAFVPEVSVHLDTGLERLHAEILGRRPDVGESSELVLRARVGVSDHAGIEARSRHDGETLAVHLSDVERALRAVQPDIDGFRYVVGDPQIRSEQVGCAGRDDREPCVTPDEGVDAALHHPVAAPDEHGLGAFL